MEQGVKSIGMEGLYALFLILCHKTIEKPRNYRKNHLVFFKRLCYNA